MWIDLVCINQDLVVERNHQLDLMMQICRGAERVVVYLGESTDSSDEAMEWIREIDVPADFGELLFLYRD
jgi:Heterokaryon incompatibility protein (HET)